jgi:hypothetical protein
MEVRMARRGLGFRRIALRPQPGGMTTCKPREHNGLPPSFNRRSEGLYRNSLQGDREYWAPKLGYG